MPNLFVVLCFGKCRVRKFNFLVRVQPRMIKENLSSISLVLGVDLQIQVLLSSNNGVQSGSRDR